ncbi:DNA recombination protein RmuC [Helicobacter apodemus]|uniref:DNA recombination protein RmuC n=1 Tax=Helicobacter apodemus TaxID=135569 RepID=A0A2U8FET7_9HELI|nr:DNA recombination protein RmuC [Helicobacter apodemus]AWI34752.1 DNA recombination protein RmuC [Helicobacter apodemus]
MDFIVILLLLAVVVVVILGIFFIKVKMQNILLQQEKETLYRNMQDLENIRVKLNEQIQLNIALETKLEGKDEQLLKMQKDILCVKEEYNQKYQASQAAFETAFHQLEINYKDSLKMQQVEHKKIQQDMQEQLQNYFKEQSKNILAQNQLTLNTDSKKILEEIFNPIKHKVEEYSKNLIHNEATLKTNIENMFRYSQNIGEKADNLAIILKGDKKIRGNFGELQLRNVLEQSGLREGEQYQIQESFNDEGKKFVPDAVIYLSKERSIVIDSKFSLPDILQTDKVDILSSEIAKNLKNRIDELAKKPYANVANAYDFVLLFIPYQNILDLALEFDNALYQYAYQRKVYLTTPNTLFMALKTIEITWIKIQSDENIMKAFLDIGRFYDKFVGVLEDFEKIKRNATTLHNTIDEMDKKLLSGNGNLANRFDALKALGAKTQKSITSVYKKEYLEV